MQLNNRCAPGQCVFRDDSHTAFCIGNKHAAHTLAQADELSTIIEEDSEPTACGLPSEEGQQCSPLIKEGGQLCDRKCKNIVSLLFRRRSVSSLDDV